jgi:ABC-type Fe3+/spermidine/putrescine transport system ATPase subunit
MTSHCLKIPFLFLALSSFLLVVNINTFGQVDISASKNRLELLKVMLEQVDAEQRKELSALQKRSAEKDEFETTKQYEERSEKQSKEGTNLRNEIDNQQGVKREKIYSEMNSIFSKEFPGTFNAFLGTYNADKQQFPIYSNLGIGDVVSVPLNEAKSFKEHFEECKKEGIDGLLLNEDNKTEEYLISGNIICKEKSYNINVGNLTASRAMRMVFGNYDDTSKRSEWTLYLQRFYVDGSDEDQYIPAPVYAKVLTIKSYVD